jgi:osmotically-inducible protein OsmY
MRWISLLLGAAAVAAAARFAIARSRRAASAPVPAPASPASPAAPRAPEPAPSAVSPAAETVKAVAPDLAAETADTPDDSVVEREVEAQLAESPVAAEADVTVEVRDRIASLEGTVPDPQTAMAIGDEAAHVDGVQGLDNRLRAEREAAADPDAEATRE